MCIAAYKCNYSKPNKWPSASEETLEQLGITPETLKTWVAQHPEVTRASHRSPHVGACNALDTLHYLANCQQNPGWPAPAKP